jgi:hypothetical protein
MICLYKLMFWFGLDLNVEAQNWRFLRISAEGSYASRQARFFAVHDLSAVDNLSALRGRSSWRTQGQKFIVGSSAGAGVVRQAFDALLARMLTHAKQHHPLRAPIDCELGVVVSANVVYIASDSVTAPQLFDCCSCAPKRRRKFANVSWSGCVLAAI